MPKYMCHECKRVFDLEEKEFNEMLLFSVQKQAFCVCGSMRIDRIDD